MDVKRYDEAVAEFEQAVKIITEAVILPKESEVSDGNNKDMGCERVAGESGYLY